MADDWIKMRVGLRRHPKVVRIVSALKADRLRVVGALHAVWSVFDEHAMDGILPGYSFEMMDEEIGWPGFSQAMHGVAWLHRDGDCGLQMPEFSTHNGASAKRRAQEADRKRREREALESRPKTDRNPSASNADAKRTRGEKRREEASKEANASLVSVLDVVTDSTPKNQNIPTATNGVTPSGSVWKAYGAAYRERYGALPVRNAKVNGQLAQFVSRIAHDEAPEVATWYVLSNKGLYLSAKHPVDLLLRDAEALRTDWFTGTQRTETEARRADRVSATASAVNELIEEQRHAVD